MLGGTSAEAHLRCNSTTTAMAAACEIAGAGVTSSCRTKFEQKAPTAWPGRHRKSVNNRKVNVTSIDFGEHLLSSMQVNVGTTSLSSLSLLLYFCCCCRWEWYDFTRVMRDTHQKKYHRIFFSYSHSEERIRSRLSGMKYALCEEVWVMAVVCRCRSSSKSPKHSKIARYGNIIRFFVDTTRHEMHFGNGIEFHGLEVQFSVFDGAVDLLLQLDLIDYRQLCTFNGSPFSWSLSSLSV